MNSSLARSFPLVLGVSLLLASVSLFAADDSKQVTLSDTPPAVQKAITTQIADGAVSGIDQANENGKITFDVSFTTKAGETSGFTVADDGTLLSVEVPLAGTPPAVQKTIQAQARDWKVEGIDKSISSGKASYDVDISKGDQEKSFTVEDDGTLSSVEVALAETPAAVQKTIQDQASGWDVGSIDKTADEDGISYDVEASKGDQEKSFTVGENGALTSMEVALADAPPAVQKTIQAQSGGWNVDSIDKNMDEDGTSYDVEVSKGGQEKNFTIGEDGALSSMEVALAETPPAVQQTIKTQAIGWNVDGIDKNIDDDGTSFEINVSKVGVKRKLTVADDGYFESMGVGLTETPLPVQAAIQKQAAGGSVKSIDEDFDPAGNSFDVDAVAKDGSKQSFTIGADGTLLGQQVTFDQTPGPAHATIANQLAGGTVKSIDETFGTPNTFDVVAVMKDGSKKSFTVGEGGRLISEGITLDQTTPEARATIQQQIGDGKIISIDRAWGGKKDKEVTFQVEGRKDGKPLNFSVGPKGKYLGAN